MDKTGQNQTAVGLWKIHLYIAWRETHWRKQIFHTGKFQISFHIRRKQICSPKNMKEREPQRSDLVCSKPCFVQRLEGTSRIHPVQPQIFPSFYSLKEFPSSCNNRSEQWLLRSGWGHHKSDHRRGQIVLLIAISKKNDKLTNHTHNGEAVFANSRQTSYAIVQIPKF